MLLQNRSLGPWGDGEEQALGVLIWWLSKVTGDPGTFCRLP